MTRNAIISLLTALLLFTGAEAVEFPHEKPASADETATSTLTDVRCAEIATASASEIACFLSFPDSVPNFFYEADSGSDRIIIKLLNTKIGGILTSGQTDTVNIGPIATLHTVTEVQNKNEAMKSLTPEWYSVVMVTINCKPMLRRQKDLVVSQMENAISVSLPWPADPKKREKYYTFVKKRHRPVLVISLIGVGVIGLGAGGYLAYDRYFKDDAAGDLEPVMPQHPSAP